MQIWKLPIPSFRFWLLVLGIVIIYIYVLKKILEAEEDYALPSIEDRLRWKIVQLKFFEIIAWIFMTTVLIIYIYGIIYLSPFIIFVINGCLIIVGYLVATYYRKQRFECQKKLKEKQQ